MEINAVKIWRAVAFQLSVKSHCQLNLLAICARNY
jgi:hypothetical protein